MTCFVDCIFVTDASSEEKDLLFVKGDLLFGGLRQKKGTGKEESSKIRILGSTVVQVKNVKVIALCV